MKGNNIKVSSQMMVVNLISDFHEDVVRICLDAIVAPILETPPALYSVGCTFSKPILFVYRKTSCAKTGLSWSVVTNLMLLNEIM